MSVWKAIILAVMLLQLFAGVTTAAVIGPHGVVQPEC
jgi:hypothetical protein